MFKFFCDGSSRIVDGARRGFIGSHGRSGRPVSSWLAVVTRSTNRSEARQEGMRDSSGVGAVRGGEARRERRARPTRPRPVTRGHKLQFYNF